MFYETKVRELCRELDIDQISIASLTGLSEKRLSLAFRGSKPFTNSEIAIVNPLCDEIKALSDDAYPFRLSFKNPEHTKQLLSMRAEGIRVYCHLGPIENEKE